MSSILLETELGMINEPFDEVSAMSTIALASFLCLITVL